MILSKIRHSFQYPELTDDHAIYGANFLSNPVINPSGDWRKALPPYELQRRHGVEPSSCYVEAQQHTIATIEEYVLNEPDNNYSARFNALLSDGTPAGGNPVAGADSIRHDGLVREDVMPHKEEIESWDEFHSWKGVDESTVRSKGKQDLKTKERNFGVIIRRGLPADIFYTLLEEGLKRSPIPISVWGATDSDGNYLDKPKGVADTHLLQAVYVENRIIHVLDTYEPFVKQLPANYVSDFGMGWTVKKRAEKKRCWLSDFNLFKVWKFGV